MITGASRGIGRATVVALAPSFDRITLVGRSRQRHAPVLGQVPHASHVECDLSSLASVANAVTAIDGDADVVIANAGVAGVRGVTADGFEIHFGVNHLAHHLLVTNLSARIRDRVIVVSSEAQRDASGVDYERVRGRTRSLTGFEEYRQSKLANVWFGRRLAARSGVPGHVVHPGMTATDIWNRVPQPFRALMTRRMIPPEQGAATSVWAATAPGLAPGGYFARSMPRDPGAVATDDDAATELWERSDTWVSEFRERT